MFLKLRARIQLFLLLQSLGMLIGSLTHLVWIINNGFLSKHYHTTIFTSVQTAGYWLHFRSVLIRVKCVILQSSNTNDRCTIPYTDRNEQLLINHVKRDFCHGKFIVALKRESG